MDNTRFWRQRAPVSNSFRTELVGSIRQTPGTRVVPLYLGPLVEWFKPLSLKIMILIFAHLQSVFFEPKRICDMRYTSQFVPKKGCCFLRTKSRIARSKTGSSIGSTPSLPTRTLLGCFGFVQHWIRPATWCPAPPSWTIEALLPSWLLYPFLRRALPRGTRWRSRWALKQPSECGEFSVVWRRSHALSY